MPSVAETEAQARAWTEHAVRTKLATEANRIVNELERQAGHAAGWLDDPRTTHPGLAGMRARMLSMLVQVGAIAIGKEG
jgi:hypothetical protein